MPDNRPRLPIKLTRTDKVLEIISAVLLLGLLIYTLISWTSLPETIPVHFNAKGQPDGWGSRVSIFFSPLLALALYILLTLLNKRPEIFNYPVRITPENAAFQYALAMRLIRLLKLSLIILFGAITWSVVHSAKTAASDAVMWVLPFALIITFLPMIYYFVNSFRKKQPQTEVTAEMKRKRSKYKIY